MTSALSTMLVSSCGVRLGPTLNTWAQMALPTISPAGVSPATVWTLSDVGTWSRATVALPPTVGTNSGALWPRLFVSADAPPESEPHADTTTHSATKAHRLPVPKPPTPRGRRREPGAAARALPPAWPGVTAGAGPKSQW